MILMTPLIPFDQQSMFLNKNTKLYYSHNVAHCKVTTWLNLRVYQPFGHNLKGAQLQYYIYIYIWLTPNSIITRVNYKKKNTSFNVPSNIAAAGFPPFH